MGLLSQLSQVEPTGRVATDEVLLLYGLITMASVDGRIDASESATLNGFLQQLPEFQGGNSDAVMAQAFELMRTRTHNGRPDISLLAALSTPALKRKLFALAVDLALSSGDVDVTEDALLEEMRQVLGIDEALAAKIIDVFVIKYAA
jgi:tellurite resistance protein